ncbi:tail fiber domain-containing protein, partial [Patescibacteria group bacterium]
VGVLNAGTRGTILSLSTGGVPLWIATSTFYTVGGTDVAVADGGTGASSLDDGFVLLGSGTGAITPLDVTTTGSIIVGDGATDPTTLGIGTRGEVLMVGAGGTPEWIATTTLAWTADTATTTFASGVEVGGGGLETSGGVHITGGLLLMDDATTGDVLYASDTDGRMSYLNAGTRGTVLMLGAGGIPEWQATTTLAWLGDSATSTFASGVSVDALDLAHIASCGALETDASGGIICGTDDDSGGGGTPNLIYQTYGATKFYTASSTAADSLAWHFEDGFVSSASSTIAGQLHLTGNVGVGSANPQKLLHLVGTTDQNVVDFPLKIQSNAGESSANTTGILFSPDSNIDRGKGGLIYRHEGVGWSRGSFHFLQNSIGDTSNVDFTDVVMTIMNSGNIGIGTTSPFAKLSIHGRAEDSDTGQKLFAIASSTPTATTTHFMITNIGRVAIGTTTPSKLLTLHSLDSESMLIDTAVPRIYFNENTYASTDNKLWDIMAFAESFFMRAINDADTEGNIFFQVDRTGNVIDGVLFPNGNIGIGTTTPGAKLSINNRAALADEKVPLFMIASSTASATTTLFEISNTGLVTVDQYLDVNGSATSTFTGGIYTNDLKTNLPGCDSLDTDASGAIICGSDATGAGGGSFAWTHTTGENINATSTIMQFSGGFISSGASSTISDTLQLVGDIYMPNLASSNAASLEWNTTTKQLSYIASSMRYKTNIRDIEIDTSKIYDLRPVSFEYNELTLDEGVTSFGLIGEELEPIFPELVLYNEYGQVESVRYKMLGVLLLAEIQKLNNRVASSTALLSNIELALGDLTSATSTKLAAYSDKPSPLLAYIENMIDEKIAQALEGVSTVSATASEGITDISASISSFFDSMEIEIAQGYMRLREVAVDVLSSETAQITYIKADYVEANKIAVKELSILQVAEAEENIVGTGRILRGDKDTIIYSNKINENSKVFVSFTSDLRRRSWHIADKVHSSGFITPDGGTADGFFRVQLSSSLPDDVEFDWWILNSEGIQEDTNTKIQETNTVETATTSSSIIEEMATTTVDKIPLEETIVEDTATATATVPIIVDSIIEDVATSTESIIETIMEEVATTTSEEITSEDTNSKIQETIEEDTITNIQDTNIDEIATSTEEIIIEVVQNEEEGI